DLGIESASVDRQRARALYFVARAHAARADDAQIGIEREVRIAEILRRVLMSAAADRITRLRDAQRVRDVLQFAVAVGRAGVALERVIRDVQLEHVLAQLRELLALRSHLHAGRDRRRARGGVTFAAFDLQEAYEPGTKRFHRAGGDQLRMPIAVLGCGAYLRGPCGDRNGHAVDLESQKLFRGAFRRARIDVVVRVHDA